MNHHYYRKGWEVIGHTFNGGAYCLECLSEDEAGDFMEDAPNPLFVSDINYALTCDICLNKIK